MNVNNAMPYGTSRLTDEERIAILADAIIEAIQAEDAQLAENGGSDDTEDHEQ